jgi:hypothetical protein
LTRVEVLKGIGAAALFFALVVLGLMLSGGEQDHRTNGEAVTEGGREMVLPLLPPTYWSDDAGKRGTDPAQLF